MFRGVSVRAWVTTSPRIQRLYAARIDLSEPGVATFVTPGNGERRADVDGEKTTEFAARHRCQLAINASPFAPVLQWTGAPKRVRGVSLSEGKLESPPDAGYGTIAFDTDRPAAVLDASITPADLRGYTSAVGGFDVILRDGEDVSARAESVRGIHPRVAVGLSADGRTLFIVVVDGRQRGWSEGASLSELARLLAELGADDGLNLDGGGSNTLVLQQGNAWVAINTPNHLLRPGLERVVANHLCVYAPALRPER